MLKILSILPIGLDYAISDSDNGDLLLVSAKLLFLLKMLVMQRGSILTVFSPLSD